MTYQDESVEVRRTSVGAKVLIFACAILAVLGSFWSIVWFIRSYVEAPRVGIPPALALAARDTTPVVPPAPVAPKSVAAAETRSASVAPAPAIAPVHASATASAQTAAENTPAPKAARNAEPMASLSDRWLPPAAVPAQPVEPSAPVQAAPVQTAPAVETAAAAEAELPAGDVAESSVPAIAGPAPLPRRKPTQTALAKRVDPPLPRPRPDGPAPQSVFTSVPVSDDRFPTQ